MAVKRQASEPSWHRRVRRQRTQARAQLRTALLSNQGLFSRGVVQAAEILRTHHSRSSLPAQLLRAQARLTGPPTSKMAQPWKCSCGAMCKAVASYCQVCGLHWQDVTYSGPSYPRGNKGGWQWQRSKAEDGKGRSPRPRGGPAGDGRQGAKTPRSPRRRPKGKGKGADAPGPTAATPAEALPRTSQEALLQEVPTAPVIPKPAQPRGRQYQRLLQSCHLP